MSSSSSPVALHACLPRKMPHELGSTTDTLTSSPTATVRPRTDRKPPTPARRRHLRHAALVLATLGQSQTKEKRTRIWQETTSQTARVVVREPIVVARGRALAGQHSNEVPPAFSCARADVHAGVARRCGVRQSSRSELDPRGL